MKRDMKLWKRCKSETKESEPDSYCSDCCQRVSDRETMHSSAFTQSLQHAWLNSTDPRGAKCTCSQAVLWHLWERQGGFTPKGYQLLKSLEVQGSRPLLFSKGFLQLTKRNLLEKVICLLHQTELFPKKSTAAHLLQMVSQQVCAKKAKKAF